MGHLRRRVDFPIRASLTLVLYLATVFAAPLAAVGAAGRSIAPFLTFPPRTPVLEPAPFTWPAFGLVALLIVISLAPFLWKIAGTPGPPGESTQNRRPFPGFGWLGLVVLGATWVVAWTRFPWAAPVQRFTFTPLWLAYIVVISALTVARTGTCPLTSDTRRFIALFPLSAIFWWSFEYLNRFVNNWYYPDAKSLSVGQYLLEATLPFSTVLPAVYSTAVWLATFPSMARGLDRLTRPRPPMARHTVLITFVLAALLLGLTAIWPNVLFPLIWIAPLLLLTALQQLLLGDALLPRALSSGDFRRGWIFALAGLVCGFFWELWNVHSLAHWTYQIPYVGRVHLFAMPLLGYAGYLPFGITCAAFIDCMQSAFPRQGTALPGQDGSDFDQTESRRRAPVPRIRRHEHPGGSVFASRRSDHRP